MLRNPLVTLTPSTQATLKESERRRVVATISATSFGESDDLALEFIALQRSKLELLEVEYQPEAAGNYDL